MGDNDFTCLCFCLSPRGNYSVIGVHDIFLPSSSQFLRQVELTGSDHLVKSVIKVVLISSSDSQQESKQVDF